MQQRWSSDPTWSTSSCHKIFALWISQLPIWYIHRQTPYLQHWHNIFCLCIHGKVQYWQTFTSLESSVFGRKTKAVYFRSGDVIICLVTSSLEIWGPKRGQRGFDSCQETKGTMLKVKWSVQEKKLKTGYGKGKPVQLISLMTLCASWEWGLTPFWVSHDAEFIFMFK